MIENGLFIMGGPGMHLHDILWAVHEGEIVVEARVRRISRSSRLRWVVVAEQCMEVSTFLVHIRVCVRGVGL